MQCSQCGSPVNDNDRFCMHCGAPVSSPEQAAPIGTVCPACGTPVSQGMRFCEQCGMSLEGVTSSLGSLAQPVAGQSAQSVTQPTATVQPVSVQPVTQPSVSQPFGTQPTMSPTVSPTGVSQPFASANNQPTNQPTQTVPLQAAPASPTPAAAPSSPAAPAAVPWATQVPGSSTSFPSASNQSVSNAGDTGNGGTGTQSSSKGNANSKGGINKAVIIAVIVALVAILAAVGIWWFVSHRDSNPDQAQTSQTASDQNASGNDKQSDGSDSSTTKKEQEECAAAPDAELQSTDHSDTTLTAAMRFTSNCSDKDAQFKQSDVKISIKDANGDVIASAIFDFSTKPLEFDNGDATATLAFTTQQYWRPYDQIEVSSVETVVQTKQSATGQPAAGAGDALGGANIADSDIERYAQLALSWQLSHDSSTAQAFYTTYTTQLSSKKYGIQAEGKTWQYRDIYEQFLQLRIKHPKAVLIWASDWPTYTKNGGTSDYYVILSGESFGSTDDGSAWCTNNGYTSEDCLVVDLQ